MRTFSKFSLALLLVGLGSCTSPDNSPPADQPNADAEGTGTLLLEANGEDFVRQGFVTKDGWQVEFDNVDVPVAQVTAYQSDPPYQPDGDEELQAEIAIPLVDSQTVDLAEGDEDAPLIQMAEVDAPTGRYNAIAWSIASSPEQMLTLAGTATKNEQTLPFTIALDVKVDYVCGDYIGDDRKGILQPEGNAALEVTFHFDHVFGDGDAPTDDKINTEALGFEPFAALAQGDEVNVDQEMLDAQLSVAEAETLNQALLGLGHVGEGHCAESLPGE